MNDAITALIGLWIIVLILMELSHRKLNRRRTQLKSAFAEAFIEWAESCDWLGYDEIPTPMYFDLVDRLDFAALPERLKGDK